MRPVVIAHRGARSLAPENTLAAARKAFELGADLWETDVRASRDGVLILMHDDDLRRTTDAQARYPERAAWPLADFGLGELRGLDAGSWFHGTDPFGEIAAGNVSENYRGEPIPTVDEALRLTKALGWKVNLELKCAPRQEEGVRLLERALALSEAIGLGPKAVIFSSFDLDLMRWGRRRAPEFRFQALLGYDPRQPIDWHAAKDFDELNPYAPLTPPQKVRALARAGLRVYPWTVNDPEEALRYFDAGAAGVFTDFPQRIVPLLR